MTSPVLVSVLADALASLEIEDFSPDELSPSERAYFRNQAEKLLAYGELQAWEKDVKQKLAQDILQFTQSRHAGASAETPVKVGYYYALDDVQHELETYIS